MGEGKGVSTSHFLCPLLPASDFLRLPWQFLPLHFCFVRGRGALTKDPFHRVGMDNNFLELHSAIFSVFQPFSLPVSSHALSFWVPIPLCSPCIQYIVPNHKISMPPPPPPTEGFLFCIPLPPRKFQFSLILFLLNIWLLTPLPAPRNFQ